MLLGSVLFWGAPLFGRYRGKMSGRYIPSGECIFCHSPLV